MISLIALLYFDSGLLCNLANEQITESSGLAASIRSPGLYWTHNDSGDKARMFCFDASGKDCGTLQLKGVDAIDCEDMAIAKIKNVPYLYLGDIGDNNKKRPSISIYKVAEPRLKRGANATTDQFTKLDFKYPDGPHDCEAMFVDANEQLFLITKEADGNSVVYTCNWSATTGTLRRAAQLSFAGPISYARMVTGASLSSDNKWVVLRTYLRAYIYPNSADVKWYACKSKEIALPLQKQGESICFDRSNSRLLISSEGKPCPISWVSLEDKK